MKHPREYLSGWVHVDKGLAVVTVVGEIDIATAALLRALVDEAIEVGAARVVVDMAGINFLDASGLSVLASAAKRLHTAGRRLEVRAVTARIYRLFAITGLVDELGVEPPSVSERFLGGVAGVAAVPFTRDVLDAALKLVVTMAQAVVSGADGVSITLPRRGQLGTVAASNDVVLEMDHDQYDTGEGPCLDAATQGERFHIDSLREEDRWPAFIPRARARGIESILSTPLVAADRPIGALNLYSRTVGAFAVHEKRWADQFAAEASVVVLSADLGGSEEDLNAQIQQALLSREVIALAQGVVMQRDGVSTTAAFVSLREVSRRTGQPLREVCEQVVRSSGDAASRDGRQAQERSADERPSA